MTRHTGYTEADRLSPMGEDYGTYMDTQKYTETEAGMYEQEKEDYQTPPSSPPPDVTAVRAPPVEDAEVALPKKKKIVKVKIKEVKPPMSDKPLDDEGHAQEEEPQQSTTPSPSPNVATKVIEPPEAPKPKFQEDMPQQITMARRPSGPKEQKTQKSKPLEAPQQNVSEENPQHITVSTPLAPKKGDLPTADSSEQRKPKVHDDPQQITMARRQSGPTDGKPQKPAQKLKQDKQTISDEKPGQVTTERPPAPKRDESTKVDSSLKGPAPNKPKEPHPEETKHIEPAPTIKPAQSEISKEKTQHVDIPKPSPSKQAEQIEVEATEKPRSIIQEKEPQQITMARRSSATKDQKPDVPELPQKPVQSEKHSIEESIPRQNTTEPNVKKEQNIVEDLKQTVPMKEGKKETTKVAFTAEKKEQAKEVTESKISKKSQSLPEIKVKPMQEEIVKEVIDTKITSELKDVETSEHVAVPTQGTQSEPIVPEVKDKQETKQTLLIEKKQEIARGIQEIGELIQDESIKGQSSSQYQQVEEDSKPAKPKGIVKQKRAEQLQQEKTTPKKEELPLLKKAPQKAKPTTLEKVATELSGAKEKLTEHTPTLQESKPTLDKALIQTNAAIGGSTKKDNQSKLTGNTITSPTTPSVAEVQSDHKESRVKKQTSKVTQPNISEVLKQPSVANILLSEDAKDEILEQKPGKEIYKTELSIAVPEATPLIEEIDNLAGSSTSLEEVPGTEPTQADILATGREKKAWDVAEMTASEDISSDVMHNVSMEPRIPDLSLVPESGSVLTSVELEYSQTTPLAGEIPGTCPSIYSDISQQQGLSEVTEGISSESSNTSKKESSAYVQHFKEERFSKPTSESTPLMQKSKQQPTDTTKNIEQREKTKSKVVVPTQSTREEGAPTSTETVSTTSSTTKPAKTLVTQVEDRAPIISQSSMILEAEIKLPFAKTTSKQVKATKSVKADDMAHAVPESMSVCQETVQPTPATTTQVKEKKSQVVVPSQVSEEQEIMSTKESVSFEPESQKVAHKPTQIQEEHSHVVITPPAPRVELELKQTEKSIPYQHESAHVEEHSIKHEGGSIALSQNVPTIEKKSEQAEIAPSLIKDNQSEKDFAFHSKVTSDALSQGSSEIVASDRTQKSMITTSAALIGLQTEKSMAVVRETQHQESTQSSKVKDVSKPQNVEPSESSEVVGVPKIEEIVLSKHMELKQKKAAISKSKELAGVARVEEIVASIPQEQKSTSALISESTDTSVIVHTEEIVTPKSMSKKPGASEIKEPTKVDRLEEIVATTQIEAKHTMSVISKSTDTSQSIGPKPVKPVASEPTKVDKVEEKIVSKSAESIVPKEKKEKLEKAAIAEDKSRLAKREIVAECTKTPEQDIVVSSDYPKSVTVTQTKEIITSEPRESSHEKALGSGSTVNIEIARKEEIVVSKHEPTRPDMLKISESQTGTDGAEVDVAQTTGPKQTDIQTKTTTKRITIQVTTDTGEAFLGADKKVTQEYEYDTKTTQSQVIIETPGTPEKQEPLISEAAESHKILDDQRYEISEVTTPEAALIELGERERQKITTKPTMKVTFEEDEITVPIIQSPDSSSDLLQEDVTERKVKRKKKKKKQPPRSTEVEEIVEVVPPQVPIAVILDEPEPVPNIPETQSKTMKLSTTSHTEHQIIISESRGEAEVIKTSTEKKLTSVKSDYTSPPPPTSPPVPPAPSADKAPPPQKQQARQKDRASLPAVNQKVHLFFPLLFDPSGPYPCMMRLYM